MAATNFDLTGFLNDPQTQANKPAAIEYLKSKGIIDASGNPVPGMSKQAAPAKPGNYDVVGQLKYAGGQIAKGFRAVTGAEQGFGQDIGAAITAPAQVQAQHNITESDTKYLSTLFNLKKAAAAKGEDTAHWDALIKGYKPQNNPAPELPSTGKVLADAGGTLFDLLSAGTYGAAKTAAMQGGKLAVKEGGTIANIATKVGMPTTQRTAPAVPTAVSLLKDAAGAVTAGTKSVAKATPGLVKTAALGKEGLKTLQQIANPEAKAFVPTAQGGGGKTFAGVVDKTQSAIDSFVASSKAALQKVKQAIPTDVLVPVEKIGTTVNDAILKSVKNSAAYHGISGDAAQMFKTPESLVHSGILEPTEVTRVEGMVKAISGWTDHSARGVLNLKEQLAHFYKPGFNGSNNILREIQTGLKDLVGEVHPQIKPALETASKNIDKAEEFMKHLVGTNEVTGESKLIQLAKNLDNPALKGYQHTLLEELKNATGHDVLPQLKGYADYLALHAKDFPTKAGTILKTVGKRTGITAAGAGALLEGKKLLGL